MYQKQDTDCKFCNLGKCPCPRCLIPLSQVHNLGMARDMLQRNLLVCINNPERQGRVFTARRLIYEKNLLVNGSAVEVLLQDMSLVLTSVSSQVFTIDSSFVKPDELV